MRVRALLANQPKNLSPLHSLQLSRYFLQRQRKHQQPTRRDDLHSGLHIRTTPLSLNTTSDNGLLMARQQNPKRERADESSQADIEPATKKAKTRSKIAGKARESWNYPPEFYDRLSKISLTRLALQELDRRTRSRRSCPSFLTRPSARAVSGDIHPRDLAWFARDGGPDLCDLRGVSWYGCSLRDPHLTSAASIPTRQPIIHILPT